MQEKQLFEYAVIRVVPKVEREEFMNVGVVLYCQSLRFLDIKFSIRTEKLKCFSAELEVEELKDNLLAFEKICRGGKAGGPIGIEPISSRFRWLTATRGTILQISPVHLGLCESPPQSLNRLFKLLGFNFSCSCYPISFLTPIS